jgi:hypothetical protein
MNWGAIGATGEILGAIAVLLTLVYLATQIRQNTKAVRASALDSSVTSVMSIRQTILESAELTTIFQAGNADPLSLDGDEQLRFRLLMQNILWSLWNVYAQSSYVDLSESVWEAQLPTLTRVMSTPGGRWFWENFRHEFEESFRSEVDKTLT